MPRTALLPPVDVAATDTDVTPTGFGSGANSCFLTEDGVGMLGWELYGVGLGVFGEPATADVLGTLMVVAVVVLMVVTELVVWL